MIFDPPPDLALNHEVKNIGFWCSGVDFLYGKGADLYENFGIVYPHPPWGVELKIEFEYFRPPLTYSYEFL